jgi:hypothetical protein
MVLLRGGVGAIGAGSVPGGALGGERSGLLRLGEGRVPSRGHVGRGKDLVARERGAEVGRRLVRSRREGRRWAGRLSAGRRRAGRRKYVERRGVGRGRGVGQRPARWPFAGDGPPRHEVRGEVVAFQRFLKRAAEIHIWAPVGAGRRDRYSPAGKRDYCALYTL